MNSRVNALFVAPMILLTVVSPGAAERADTGVVARRAVSSVQGKDAGTAPERAVREFIRALAMHDAQAFNRAIRPDPRASRFLNPQPLTPEGREEASRRLESLQVSRRDEVLLRGKPVTVDAQGDYPLGSVGHFVAAGPGGPSVVTIVRQPDGWKVDLRWWLAMMELANAQAPPAESSPEYAIRGLTLSLISLDRDKAMEFAVPGARADVLFAGAPSTREPSGVLEASAMEMPLVEVGSGEFFRLPSGRVIEGVAAADRKVVVGQFGPVEMPFVLRLVSGKWRVEAEPYFALINR